MNWVLLFLINFLFSKEPFAGSQDFYNYFSSDYSLRWDYFKDGIPFFMPLNKDFELAINSAHKSLLLFKDNKITYPDSQTIVSVYSERDRYESNLNGFSFQRELFRNFLRFRTGYDIYTSKVFSEMGTVVQHHYFFQGYRENTFDFLYYHSDFDYPFYYLTINLPQKERFEAYKFNYYIRNLKIYTDYQYINNLLEHSSISQLKSEITLNFTYKLLNFNLTLRNKVLKYQKEKEKYRFGGEFGVNFKRFFYINFDYERDKKLHNQFLIETAFNFTIKRVVFVPFFSSMLLFPNPVIESGIFPLYSTPYPERERRNSSGIYIFDENFKNINFVYEYADVKDMRILKILPYEIDTFTYDIPRYDTLSARFHSFQTNIYMDTGNLLFLNNSYLKSSLIYNTLENFYPNLSTKISVGLEKKVKEKVKLVFEYSTFLTEKTNMNSCEVKANFFDALFITFRVNNIFNQKFYLLEGFNFYSTHFTLFASANLWD